MFEFIQQRHEGNNYYINFICYITIYLIYQNKYWNHIFIIHFIIYIIVITITRTSSSSCQVSAHKFSIRSLSACQFVSPGPACCGGQCGATDLPGRHSQDWPAPIGGAAAAASSVSIYHHRYNPDLKWRKKEITLWHNWELKQSDTESVSSPQSSIFIGFPPDETFATGSARLIDAAISFIRLSWKLNAFQ